VNKDASVAEIAAAAAVVPVSAASSAPVLLFPELPGLMRPSSYALDPSAPPSASLNASAIIAALPPPLCLFWQPYPVDTHVRAMMPMIIIILSIILMISIQLLRLMLCRSLQVDLNIMFFNSRVEPQRNHNIKVGTPHSSP
jgi:hypothetical protein